MEFLKMSKNGLHQEAMHSNFISHFLSRKYTADTNTHGPKQKLTSYNMHIHKTFQRPAYVLLPSVFFKSDHVCIFTNNVLNFYAIFFQKDDRCVAE